MIEASVLHARDLPDLAGMWTEILAHQGSSCTLSPDELQENVLLHGGEPRTILAIDPRGWIVARHDGKMVGFVHCTVGRLPQDSPETLRGFVRTLLLTPDAPPAVTPMLLRAADNYFRTKNNLSNIIAFHIHTGYPFLDDARGTLLHEQWALMEAVGGAGYRLSRRWLFYQQVFDAPVIERLPHLSGLELHWDDLTDETLAVSARLEFNPIATARFMLLPRPRDCSLPRTASLYHFEVEPEMRQQGIGRWLLARSVNHLLAIGFPRLLVDAPHEDALFHARLRRLGFHEQAQRGYTYEKAHVR